MGNGRGFYRVWWGKLREGDHWEDPGIDGKIILRSIFRKWGVGVWTGLRRLRRVEACTGFWWKNLQERDHWGDTGVEGRIILR
jgi:hypothetical protein